MSSNMHSCCCSNVVMEVLAVTVEETNNDLACVDKKNGHVLKFIMRT